MTDDHGPSIADANILVVDDTPANIGVLIHMLEDQGYRVLAATSGEQALKIAARVQPELILLDLMMPGMDGLETCRRIKGDERTCAIPVIFVTAQSDTEFVVEGFRVGAVDYVQKPFRQEEVCARVATHLKMGKYLARHRHDVEHLRAIVNNMAEGLLLIAPDGAVRSANPAAHHLLGYQNGQSLAGCAIGDLLEAPYGAHYREYFSTHATPEHRADSLRHGPHEVVMRTGSQGQLHLDLTITRMFGAEPLFIGLLHDISAHKQAHQAVLRLAHLDPLTNIANRRHFDDFLRQEWNRAQRSGEALAIALFDVDLFKLYNDALGHLAGDVCLQQVAKAIATLARRPTDLAARYGGEEFVLVFAETDAAAAAALAEEARRRVAALSLPHPQAGGAGRVSVSVGVASAIPDLHGDPAGLFARADAALYRAKAAGRDRVELAH